MDRPHSRLVVQPESRFAYARAADVAMIHDGKITLDLLIEKNILQNSPVCGGSSEVHVAANDATYIYSGRLTAVHKLENERETQRSECAANLHVINDKMPLTQLYRLTGRPPEDVAFPQLTVAIDLVLSKGRVNPEAAQIFQLPARFWPTRSHINQGQNSMPHLPPQ